MDIRMPIMNGLEAASAIRKMDRKDAASVPIIALTANAYEEDRQKSLNAGMNEHLTKPLDPALLYSVLEKCIYN
jgi:CheY-like chemotaxis protein